MNRPLSRRLIRALLLASALCAPAGAAVPFAEEDYARLIRVRTLTAVGYESYYGRPDEGIGLVGFRFDRFLSERLYAGAAIYGAVAGDRGGYGVAALGAGWQRALAPRLHWDTRLMAGSGGGSGIRTGGGFMVHAATGFQAELTSRARLAFHGGYLAFPSGRYRTPVAGVFLVFTGARVMLPD